MVIEGKRRLVAQHYDGTGEIKKGPWKPEEDRVLINHVKTYGPRDWSSIRSKGLLQRTGKSCRLRWVNKLRPDLKNGVKFSPEEERTVIDLQAQIGNKWATIATYLTGRTDNDVKNFWSSRQKRLARIQQTSLVSPNKAQRSCRSKGVKALVPVPHDPSSVEATKLSWSSKSRDEEKEEEEVSVNRVEVVHMNHHPVWCYYGIGSSMPLECLEPQPNLVFPQHFPDPVLMDMFGEMISGHIETPAGVFGGVDRERQEEDVVGVESLMEDYDFPPMDVFDEIETLPSPSKWF